jgi:cytochrome c553
VRCGLLDFGRNKNAPRRNPLKRLRQNDPRRGPRIPNALVICVAALLVGYICAGARSAPAWGDTPREVPAWAFPINPPEPAAPAPFDRVKPLYMANSKVAYTEAQLNDLFAAPDWHPDSHAPMPEVVAHGNPPDVYACAYCHTPTGQGRPENASLAGLPAQYIIQQSADFKNGARRSAWSDSYRPSARMIQVATHASADEVAAAAQYFSMQHLGSRVKVLERSHVPKTHVVGWVYVADGRGAEELLGERLLELAPDAQLHERRADDMRYIAYVPLGSIGRGRSIVRSGEGAPTMACVTCHGENLQGIGLIPALAGRSPTYILRQLLAFKTGARAGATGQPMQAVVADLHIGNMIDIAAYAASLQP